jgi:hypothetical protein
MCTGILSFVTQYDRYYCFRCNAYPPEGVFMETRTEAPSPPSREYSAASQTALVLAEPAKVEETKPTPAEEPKPAPIEVEMKSVPIETTVEPAPETHVEDRAEEELAPEEPVVPVSKPALVRSEILEAKKPVLMDLAKAYELDPAGTKEQLRERLLSYLDDQEAKEKSEAVPEEIPKEIPQEASKEIPKETQPEPAVVASPAPVTTPPLAESHVAEVKSPPRMVITAAPRMVPEIPKPAPIMAVAAEPAPSTPIFVEPFVSPAPSTAPVVEHVVAQPPTVPIVKAQHPCPTCGRELTFIPQYNRSYCYSCRLYAPKAKSKFACPTCGAALRWIPQYERWWCDSDRKYAPADLPRPERSGILATSAVAVARTTSTAVAATVHRHRSPGNAIGLVGFGMVLLVLYELLVDLPAALASGSAPLLGLDVGFGLRFFGFLFLGFGIIMGLYAVRDQR